MKKSLYIALSASLAAFSAPALVADNLIENGDFSDELASWTPFVADWEGVSADFSVTNDEAAVTGISGAGAQPWYVQLNQELTTEQIDALEVGGVYTASFDARSSTDGRSLRFFFGEDGGDFTPMTATDFTLSDQMDTYSVTFTVTATFAAMKLGFEMGNANDDVFIDNVSLVYDEMGEAPGEQPPTPTGFVANNDSVDWGQVFVAAGPNNVAEPDLEFRLFYSISGNAPSDPTTASQYIFGSTTADGGGTGPFGFVITDLEPGTEYTFWLYQYNTATGTYSAPAMETATSGGEAGSANPPATPDGFVAFDTVGEAPVGSGEVFLAAGPNNTGGDISYRLFYSTTASAPSDPTTATEYTFGTTAGDGEGTAAFGFVLSGLNPGTDYTFWLYQYDNSADIFSNNAATATVVSGGSNGNGNGNGGGTPTPAEPATASPIPTEPADEVISIFSSVYSDVPVDTFRTGWSVAEFDETMIEGVATLRYTSLDFVGIETVNTQINASDMEYFHIDVWTPNMDVIRIKLVDFGPDGAWAGGDDTEHELVFEGLAQGEWHSLQIPLADFTGMLNQANLAQFILSGTPSGAGTLFVDNIYLSGSGEATTPPTHFAGFPIDAKGNINTGDFLGPIHVSSAPWVYIFDLNRWVYMVDPGENLDGSWSYFMNPESNSQP